MLHVPDDLTQVAGQVLAGEGEGFLGAAEGQRGRQGFCLGGGDSQAQGDSCAAIPVGHHLLAIVLRRLCLWVGDDALWVAVSERLRWAGLEGALELHHVKGILRDQQKGKQGKQGQKRKDDASPPPV